MSDETTSIVAWLRSLPQNRLQSVGWLATCIERGDHRQPADRDELTRVVVNACGADAPLAVVQAAARRTCELFDVHPRDLFGGYRYGFLIPARFAFYTGLSRLGWKGRRLGRAVGRSHGTVRHGVESAGFVAERDPAYAAKIEDITNAALRALKEQTT